MWNLSKVNNKDTRTTPMPSFWCLYCKLSTYFTPCSNVSIVNFEQVNADWERFKIITSYDKTHDVMLWIFLVSLDTFLNPLNANLAKWSNTILSIFDHFVGLALKGLTQFNCFCFQFNELRVCADDQENYPTRLFLKSIIGTLFHLKFSW